MLAERGSKGVSNSRTFSKFLHPNLKLETLNFELFSSLFRRKSVDNILKDIDEIHDGLSLKRNLNVRDLTALGIAAVIGAGIFSTIGTAAANGGPAISLLFIFTAVACSFSALCYALSLLLQFLSVEVLTHILMQSFGELIAWIIGWDLIMGICSWKYCCWPFPGLVILLLCYKGFGINISDYLTIDYLTAFRGHKAYLMIPHDQLSTVNDQLKTAYFAWNNAPHLFGIRFICNLPAFCITAFITSLVYIGIRESKIAGNIMVLIKIAILLLIIGVGAFYVNPHNWTPFAPNGLAGVLKGVSGVFFAYIGFDAISTTAEECKNPSEKTYLEPSSMPYLFALFYIL